MHSLPPHVDYFEGKKNGPCVVIVGSVHGNERLGEAVISKLRVSLKAEEVFGKIILILGNPKAFDENKRFIDCDLNRLFGADFIKLEQKTAHTLNTEEKRALEIAPYLETADFLLDIHCTIKPSVPFIFCEKTKKHLKIAQMFGTEYIVSIGPRCRIPSLTSAIDTFTDAHGGIGITYEAGWHKKPMMLSHALGKVNQFLSSVDSLESHAEGSATPHVPAPKHLIIYDYLIPQTPHFHFTKDFSNFDTVQAGEAVAEDDGKTFKVKKTSFIIFPKIDIVAGSPACYVAYES